jgi:hypothetical protein
MGGKTPNATTASLIVQSSNLACAGFFIGIWALETDFFGAVRRISILYSLVTLSHDCETGPELFDLLF